MANGKLLESEILHSYLLNLSKHIYLFPSYAEFFKLFSVYFGQDLTTEAAG